MTSHSSPAGAFARRDLRARRLARRPRRRLEGGVRFGAPRPPDRFDRGLRGPRVERTLTLELIERRQPADEAVRRDEDRPGQLPAAQLTRGGRLGDARMAPDRGQTDPTASRYHADFERGRAFADDTLRRASPLHEIGPAGAFAGGIPSASCAGWFRPDAAASSGRAAAPVAAHRDVPTRRPNPVPPEPAADRGRGHRLLVETGTGVRMSDGVRDIKGVEGGDPVEALRAVVEGPDSIDFVVLIAPPLRPRRRDARAMRGRPLPNARYVVSATRPRLPTATSCAWTE